MLLRKRRKRFALFLCAEGSGLARFDFVSKLTAMNDPATLSRDDLLELLERKNDRLQQQDAELQSKTDIIAQLEQKNKQLEADYLKLWQERFGHRSERYIADADQLRLDFGDTDDAADASAGLAEAVEDADLIPAHRRRKPRKKRDESLPEHLPRREVTAEVPDELMHCPTHGERTLLPESMWDRTEKLIYHPPVLEVLVTRFRKFSCAADSQCGIASPERSTGIVEGDKYDSTVAAQIITAKFGYHLPVYRQQDYFAGSGWAPSRSTLLNILAGSHFVLEPLLAYFKQTVQSDPVVGCDDTGVTLLYPKELPQFDLTDPKERRIHEVFSKALDENKPSIRAKMWAYRGMTIPLNVFDFTVSRHRDGPELFFENYRGSLLGDCWHGFESIALNSNGAILRAACNAHARRKIRESSAYPREAARWLVWYRELYDIEDRGRVMSPKERLALRERESRPIWDAMELWLSEVQLRTSNVILPKSDFGKALQYVRNHLTELQRYLSDPLLPIDNNEVEQLMKQVALGRKNWLFAGSVAGGERSAGFMTLVSSALRNDLDVWQYVADVLDQLLCGVTAYEPLLPWNWSASHPEAIRTYRIAERQSRTDDKRHKRAARRRQKQPG